MTIQRAKAGGGQIDGVIGRVPGRFPARELPADNLVAFDLKREGRMPGGRRFVPAGIYLKFREFLKPK